jgi:hypothetical protein
MNMIDSLLEKLTPKMPEVITIDKTRHFLLEKDDESFEYKEVAPDAPTPNPQVRNVSTIESLKDIIKHLIANSEEEAHKLFEIALDDEGATFYPDFTHGNRHKFVRYERCKSQQWVTLLDLLDEKPLAHAQFIKKLRTLRPSIEGFNDFYRQWSTITISDDNAFVSAPDITQDGSGAASASMKVKIKNTNAESDVNLPFSFDLTMPLVRGSEETYSFEAVIDATGVANNQGSRDWKFSVSIPELNITKDLLLQDEADYITEQFIEKPLLIVKNYTAKS